MEERKKVLVVDDERLVRESVRMAFEREGMEAVTASSGQEALLLLEKQNFDLIVLDVMMDVMDGIYVVKLIRQKKIYTPVLFLSGNQEEQSKILAISMGGDDYITKPFSLALLTTKANALIRRNNEYTQPMTSEIVCGELTFSLNSYTLSKNDEIIPLTSKETNLVKFLMENQNQVFTKEQLYENVWKQSIVDDNTIMVYIKKVRDKIEDNPKKPVYLRTVWGLGYIFGSEIANLKRI